MKDKKTVIIIILVAAILVGVIEIALFSRVKKKETDMSSMGNHYTISQRVEELPGTNQYTNPKLREAHCLDSVCVENVVFFYTDEGGRIEYDLVGTSSKQKSGLMKMVFGNQMLTIAYQDMVSGKRIHTNTYYTSKKIKQMEDYHLELLTEEENSKIVYTNK